MIQNLKILHGESQAKCPAACGNLFILQTCQRTLLVGFEHAIFNNVQNGDSHDWSLLQGQEAYLFLLETLCGLKSRVLGEYEIVSQFKKAYAQFLENSNKDKHLMKVIEKLLFDGKKIRSQYLMKIGQQSYAGITRKIITERHAEGEILILGSGQLAEDLIKILRKRYRLSISARNKGRISELSSLYDLKIRPWGEDMSLYADSPFVINTVGTSQSLFHKSFFEKWSKTHHSACAFIDLSTSNSNKEDLPHQEHIFFLQDIFEMGGKLNNEKLKKVEKARTAIEETVEKRQRLLSIPNLFNREESKFV